MMFITSKKRIFEVIVGNVGIVYTGSSRFKATYEYNTYVKISKTGSGRASGESVALIENGHVVREYEGSMQDA